MGKYAYIFPGQGAQYVGMFRTICQIPEAVKVYEEASEILGYDLIELCSKGTLDQLRQTEFTQVSIFTHSMAIHNVLKEKGVTPEVLAGHSVGEFSAIVAAGVLSFPDALRLVQKRGQLMASVKREGSMVSVVGLPLDGVKKLCEKVKEAGYISVSLINTQNQFVLSGDVEAVDAAYEKAKEAGALKTVKLKVSQAFHSELMREIQQDFNSYVEALNFSKPKYPIILNCTAEESIDEVEIKSDIKNQLVSPVMWYDSMRTILDREEELIFLEIGPGKTLSGMLRTIEKGTKSVVTDVPRELGKFLKGLEG